MRSILFRSPDPPLNTSAILESVEVVCPMSQTPPVLRKEFHVPVSFSAVPRHHDSIVRFPAPLTLGCYSFLPEDCRLFLRAFFRRVEG